MGRCRLGQVKQADCISRILTAMRRCVPWRVSTNGASTGVRPIYGQFDLTALVWLENG